MAAVTIAGLTAVITTRMALAYAGAQLAGGVLGVWLAHLMFDVPILELSTKARGETGQLGGST